MDSNAPNAMIARLKEPPRPPNAVIAKGRNRGKLQMLLSPRKNALDSLFKEARAFKVEQVEKQKNVDCDSCTRIMVRNFREWVVWEVHSCSFVPQRSSKLVRTCEDDIKVQH